jgi:preprotein translocase subunit SecE
MSKISQFLREVQVEFKNITWPKKDALIQLTIVVISFSVVISLILGGFDYLFTQSFQVLSNLKSNSVIQEEGAPIITIAPEASISTELNTSTPSANLAAPTSVNPQPTK